MFYAKIYLAALAFGMPLACLADGGIYAFVDAKQGVFLSNVPDDERYQVLIAPAPSADRMARAAPARREGRPRFDVLIKQMASRFGIDAALLRAVISVESGYDPNALSRRGAAGLMQLMPDTARRYRVKNVFDPADNVRGGAQYLADLLKKFENDVRLALAAYNAGEAAVRKYDGRIPPYPETVAYVPKVVGIYQRYQQSTYGPAFAALDN